MLGGFGVDWMQSAKPTAVQRQADAAEADEDRVAHCPQPWHNALEHKLDASFLAAPAVAGKAFYLRLRLYRIENRQ